jgi:hypothetical protein
MSGTLAAQIVIPIVALVALFGWLVLVLRADNHPGWKHHSNLPKTEVAGGAFQAVGGGRQLMPIHGERPMLPDGRYVQSADIPVQRTAEQPGAPATAGQQAPATSGDAPAGNRDLVAGSKLR